MTLDRPSLKRRAIEIIRDSQPKVIYVALVYVLLMVVVAMLSGRLMGLNYSQEDIQKFYEYAANGDYDYFMRYIDTNGPSAMSSLIDTLLTVVMSIVEAGFVLFLLNTIYS